MFKTELDPTIPLGGDKPRDIDPLFRVLANQAVDAVLTDLAIPHHPLLPTGHSMALRLAIDHVQDQIKPPRPLEIEVR